MPTSPYFTILGLPDLMNSPNASIEAFDEVLPSMPAANLATERPDEFWSSDGLSGTSMYIVCGLNTYGHIPFPANAVALVSHNLWQESAQYRVVALSEKFSALAPYSYIAPDGDSDRVNVTGTYADVDGGGPGVTKISPTSLSDYWAINLDFGTPSANPRVNSGTGGHYQSFILFVKSSSNTLPHLAPVLTLTVYAGGIGGQALTSVTKRITEADGQYVYVDFSTSEGSNGSNISLYVEGIEGLAGAYIEGLYYATWACETTGVSADPTLLYDSGWQRLPQQVGHPTAVANTFHSRLRPSTLLHQFGQTVNNIDWIWILIREDHCPVYTNDYEVASVPTRPPGYIQAGKLVVGETWSPTAPPSNEPQFVGILNTSPQDLTRGGQEFGAESSRLRTATVTLSDLTKTEGMFILERLVRERGVLGPVVISLNPDGGYDEEPTTFYATLEDSEISLSAKPGGDFTRSITLRFKEKL